MEVLHLPESLDRGDKALNSLTRAGIGGHRPAQWLCMHRSCPLELTAKAEAQDELGAHSPTQELAALSTIIHSWSMVLRANDACCQILLSRGDAIV